MNVSLVRWTLIATAVLCCAFMAFASDADSAGAGAPAPVAGQSPAQALVERHAPIVYIRNQDEACDRRGSPYLPAPVEFLFDQEAIVLFRHEDGRNVEVARNIDAGDLYGLDNTYFIDTPGDPKRPGCTYERDYLARTDAYEPTVYAHITSEEGRDGIALQYWFYYYFNDWNNTHEGDWEMVQLTFRGPTVEDALTQEPLGVGYSQHAGGERSSWDDDKLTKEGMRPVAFAAAGANANQFEPNIILGRGDNGTGFGCDDASRPSRRVDPTAILVEEPDSSDSEFAWLAFDGRWGERAPWEFNGPTGPNDKLAWTQPFTWQERLRPSSIIVPSRETLGPNAVNFFCDAVWYLSAPFSVLVRLPPIVLLSSLVAMLGVIGYTFSRTQYRPVIDTPLRRRRRLGQMLSASVSLYRKNLLVFLGIGLLYLPTALLGLGVHWLLSRPDLTETLTRFFSWNRGVEAALALTAGNVTSSLTYWIVFAASTAAVARIDKQGRASTLSSYRDVWKNLPPLSWTRLKALAIIIALSITVIGGPVAVWLAVRWAFLEEAVLLDGADAKTARPHSERAVSGRWLYVLLCVAALWAIGFLLGPTVAFVLLFTTGASVYTVNLVSSLIFAAVVPFVAAAQAMLYFELSTSDDVESKPSEALT